MSNHTCGAPTWLTSSYLERMMSNFFNDDSVCVENLSIEPGSSIGDNYIGQLLRIGLNYTRKNQKESKNIIAKILPNTALNEEFNKGLDVFKVEMNMLSETLPLLYEVLKEKGETERFFPYLYGRDIENKTIFMEDLKAEGYVMVDKKTSLDLDHTLLVIKALAKLHASSYLLIKKDPTQKENYLEIFFKKEAKGNFQEKMTEGSLKCLLKTLDLWPINEEDKQIFRNFQGKIFDYSVDVYQRKESSFNAILHGDCWTNNFMFKYQNGKVDSVKLIDFQVTSHSSIGLDLNYFLFSSAQPYVKLEHLEDVLKRYYDAFVSVTGEIEGFTLDTVRKEFTERLGFGFVYAVIFRCIMYAKKPFDTQAYLEERESEDNLEMFRNPEFISEAVKLLPLFKKHGVFK